MVYTGAVRDTRRGTATPQQAATENDRSDYNPGDEWQQDFSPWYATADVQLVDGQAILSLDIFDDNVVEGYETVEWTLDPDVPCGFTREIYIVSENDDAVNIPVSSQSSYKTATIIIQDNDSVVRAINGDAGNNLLNGDSRNDSIFAQSGDDTLKGKNGDDNLYGEADNDTLKGGAGNDYLDGGSGNDQLKGEGGDDILDGSEGDDRLDGGAGNDKLLGYLGNDVLKGNDGDDFLGGEAGNDSLEGGKGNDTLSGGEGSDTLKGGAGDDTLIGGVSSDTLTGGAGADQFTFYSRTEAIDTITDFLWQEGDKLVVSASDFGWLAIGELLPEQFTIGSAATQASHRFIYDAFSGALFFDFDGVGGFGQEQIASLSIGLSLTSSDILVSG